MKIIRSLLLAALSAVSTVDAIAADPANDPFLHIDQQWKRYELARQELAKVKKPVLGEEDFAKKLGVWAEANRKKNEAARALVQPLVALTSTVPDDQFQMVRDELRIIHKDLTDAPTQASNDARGFFAAQVLPHLCEGELKPDRADLFVELTAPNEWIKAADRRIQRGELSEPVGFAVQDAHALALAQAGDFKGARQQSDLLLKKMESLLGGRLPKLGINHRDTVRTKPSLHREFLLHRALIESLAGEAETAKERLAAAKTIKEEDKNVLAEQGGLLERLGR